MLAEPGPAELMRGLAAVREEIRGLTAKLDEGYVRKDVQDARDKATEIQIKGLEDEQYAITKRIDEKASLSEGRIDRIEERLTAHFRLLVGGFIYPLIVGIVVYVLLVPQLHHS
jgi:hypothetical protein